MKRFWDFVTIADDSDGFTVLLDGRPMHLPDGTKLRVRPRLLAEAIAAEWQSAGGAKDGEMSFADTPLTRLAGTAQQRVAPDPAITVDAIARYAENDLLCYRAATPEALVQRQAQAWQPWLDWVALAHDAPLRVTTGVTHIRQHRDSVAALRRAVAALNVETLAALGIAVPALGSVVLGLALAASELDAPTAHALGALEELFQAEQWGEDAEAVARREAIAADIALAARFIALAKDQPS
jgi:chaperone required for assembly of F1-ATPase